MIHPAFSHFAVVIPLIALVFSFAYFAGRTDTLSRISTRLVVFGFIVVAISWKSGLNDGRDAAELLIGEGSSLLEMHKSVGTALLIIMGVAALLKYFGCFAKRLKFEATAVLLLTFATGLSLYQAVLGASLVYEHAAGVQQKTAQVSQRAMPVHADYFAQK